MKNTIYQGIVIHNRLTPRKHQFLYKVCYFFFDLDQPKILPTIPLLLTFNPRKYLTSKELKQAVSKELGPDASAKIKSIYILTQLSYFGFCFNPVSFYYCYDDQGQLQYIVSLITNTPWGEKHLDFLDYQKNKGEFKFLKNFHVSPFMPMEISYHWKFNEPNEDIDILMKNRHFAENDYFFYAQMNLKAKEMNYGNALRSLVAFPLMSFKTVVGIYWQASLLYFKKIPFYTHPKKREAI